MSDDYDFRPPDDPIAGTTILCIIDGCNRAVAVSASVVSSSVTGGWVAETAKELAHRLGWTSDGSWLCPLHSRPEEPETRSIRSASGSARLPPPRTLADRVADLEAVPLGLGKIRSRLDAIEAWMAKDDASTASILETVGRHTEALVEAVKASR